MSRGNEMINGIAGPVSVCDQGDFRSFYRFERFPGVAIFIFRKFSGQLLQFFSRFGIREFCFIAGSSAEQYFLQI